LPEEINFASKVSLKFRERENLLQNNTNNKEKSEYKQRFWEVDIS